MKAVRIIMLIAGILLIICGILLLRTPFANVIALAIFIAIAMLVSGIADIIGFFNSPSGINNWWLLIGGILTVALSAWLIFGNYAIASFASLLPILFAVWLLIASMTRLIGALTTREFGYGKWWIILILAIIGLGIGVLILFQPSASARILGYLIPIVFIFEGIVSIIQFILLGRRVKSLKGKSANN